MEATHGPQVNGAAVHARGRAASARIAGSVVKAVVTVLALGYVVLVVLGFIPPEKRLGWLELGLIALAGLFASGVLDGLRELSVGAEGLKIVRELKERQTESEVDLLSVKLALTGLVTKYEAKHLKELAAPGPYHVHWRDDLFAEIARLDAIGYLDPKLPHGFNAIREDHAGNPAEEFDLKRYMEITELGRTYLEKRREVEAALAPA